MFVSRRAASAPGGQRPQWASMDAGWSELRSHDGAPNEMAPHELSQEVDSWLCVPTTDKGLSAAPTDTEQLAAPKDGVASDECAAPEAEGTSHQVAHPPGRQEIAASTAITLAARPAVPAFSERHHVAASDAASKGCASSTWRQKRGT